MAFIIACHVDHALEQLKKLVGTRAGVAQLAGASSCKPKGRGFNSWSGHMPRLWVLTPVGVHARGN